MWSTESSLSNSKQISNPTSLASSHQNSVTRETLQSQLEHYLKPKSTRTDKNPDSRYNKPITSLQKHRSSFSTSSSYYNPKTTNDSEVSFAQKHFFQPGFDSIPHSNPSQTFSENSIQASEQIEYKLPLKPIVNTRDLQKSTHSSDNYKVQSSLSYADSLLKPSLQQETNRLATLNSLLGRRGSSQENGGVSLESSIGIGSKVLNKSCKVETSSAAAVGAMKALQERLAKAEIEIRILRTKLRNETQGDHKGSEETENEVRALINENESFKERSRRLSEENELLKRQINSYRKAMDAVNQENQALRKERISAEPGKQVEHQNDKNNNDALRAYAEEILKKLDFERKKAQGLEEQLYRLQRSPSARQERAGVFNSHRSTSNERMMKRNRTMSERSESCQMSQSQRIDYKVRAEALEKENENLRMSNAEISRAAEKLEKKLAILKLSKERLKNYNIEKKDLFNQVLEVNRELISKLSENFKYGDLRDVLSKMAQIENHLQRERSLSAKRKDQSFSSLSPKCKIQHHRSQSSRFIKASSPSKSFNRSYADSIVSYRTDKSPNFKKDKLEKNKENRVIKKKLKSRGNAGDNSSISKNSRPFFRSYDERAFIKELSGSKDHKRNLLS